MFLKLSQIYTFVYAEKDHRFGGLAWNDRAFYGSRRQPPQSWTGKILWTFHNSEDQLVHYECTLYICSLVHIEK